MDDLSNVHAARGLAWMALVVSVIALLFAISAYGVSRSNAGEENMKMGSTRAMDTSSGLRAAALEARQELESARTAFESNGNASEVLMRLNQAEVNLAEAFHAAGRGARDEWEMLKPAFEDARARLREGSTETVLALETLIERITESVREDR